MSKREASPAQWKAVPQPGQTESHYYTHEVWDAEGECVASLLTIANARLIAAAPDLLAACEAMLDPEIDMLMTAAMVRAAVAKAKGATP